MFAVPIQIKYRGQDKYRTLWGGVLSLAILCTLVIDFMNSYHSLYHLENFMITKEIKHSKAQLDKEMKARLAAGLISSDN
jgi:hypothetical protein